MLSADANEWSMNFIQSGQDAAGNAIELFYQDLGSGKPVVLIHGWPLSEQMWEYQKLELPQHGLRCVSYDRRGFGRSSKPWSGYVYDTLADDLKAVLDGLDLQDATLVGFSMGGGEVARYMSRHGGARVAKVAFVSAVTPFMLKTDDNPSGVDKSTFDQMIEGLQNDHADFLASFGRKFFGTGMLSASGIAGTSVSEAVLDWTQSLAMRASLKATIDCVRAFGETDFRADLATIEVPALIIHGEDDQTVPIATGGEQTARLLPNARFLRYEGAPHGLMIPKKEKLNRDLIEFIR